MTPKEKAEELIHKFYEIENDSMYYGVSWKIAKQCAIIAVDEIIKNYDEKYKYCNTKVYWEEVKKEIEKL